MFHQLNDNLGGKQHDYMAPFLWLHGEAQNVPHVSLPLYLIGSIISHEAQKIKTFSP